VCKNLQKSGKNLKNPNFSSAAGVAKFSNFPHHQKKNSKIPLSYPKNPKNSQKIYKNSKIPQKSKKSEKFLKFLIIPDYSNQSAKSPSSDFSVANTPTSLFSEI
jgi:hypothetical protein